MAYCSSGYGSSRWGRRGAKAKHFNSHCVYSHQSDSNMHMLIVSSKLPTVFCDAVSIW